MKVDNILLIDCTKEENIEKIKHVLLKIKPVKKATNNGEDFSIEILEKCLHNIAFRYGYRVQWITPYYEESENRGFVMYSLSLIKRENGTNVWKGTTNSRTLWEMVAKGIIQIYASIKAGEKKND